MMKVWRQLPSTLIVFCTAEPSHFSLFESLNISLTLLSYFWGTFRLNCFVILLKKLRVSFVFFLGRIYSQRFKKNLFYFQTNRNQNIFLDFTKKGTIYQAHTFHVFILVLDTF